MWLLTRDVTGVKFSWHFRHQLHRSVERQITGRGQNLRENKFPYDWGINIHELELYYEELAIQGFDPETMTLQRFDR